MKEDRYIESASLLHLVMSTEVMDEDKPASHTDLVEDLKPGHIDHLVEVLQVRVKEIRDGKK